MARIVPHDSLRRLACELLVRGGSPEAEARSVADHLVDANLAGHDSHGVGMIPTYTWSMKCGACKPAAHAALVSEAGAVLVIDGQQGFGQVVGPEAMRWGIEKARAHGVAALALRRAHHLGRIGAYAELAVGEGLLSMHYVNVVGHPPQVAPFEGAEARLNTNPFCCAVPMPDGEAVVLDMATSTVALGKVREAAARGDAVPEGALVDADGRPTTDPGVLFGGPTAPKGALTAFGLHKGSGLGVICELLGGALAGSFAISTPYDGPPTVYNNMLAILLDPTAFGDASQVAGELQALREYMRATRPSPGVPSVRVPGDPEREQRGRRLQDGVPVADGTWRELCDIGEKFGLARAAIEEMTSP